MREVREETGLHVTATHLLGVYDSRLQPGPVRGWHAYTLVFGCRPDGGALTVNHEVTAFAWCTEAEACALDLTGGTRLTVPDAFAWHRDPTRTVFH